MEEDIPAIPVNDSLMQGKDTANIWTGCLPDVTFLMKMDPRVGRRRINVQQQDRLEREKDDFHVRTYEGYLELEKKYPGRIVGIDAARSIEEIKIDIYKKLEEVLKGVTE